MQTTSKPYGRYSTGVLLTLASAAAFGVMPVFAAAADRSGASLVTTLFLRFTIAALVMFAWLLRRGLKLPDGKTLFLLACMGAIGYAGQAFSYFTALTMAPAGTVALLLYTYPAIVTILSVTVLRQSILKSDIIALGLASAGIVMVAGIHTGGQAWGIFWALMAALIYSLYIIVGTVALRNTDSFTAATIINTTAAMIYAAVALRQGLQLPGAASGWAAVVCIALISTVLAIGAFFSGIKRIGPVQASMLSMAEPVVTLVFSCLLLGEILTTTKVAGGILVVGAGLLLTYKRGA